MEDQVPFKVFTYWTEDSKPEVRRFGVEKTVVTSFHYLNAKLQDVYPGLKGRNYSVTWKDEDGDDITISSDEEVMTALTSLHGNLMKLDVHVNGGAADDKDDVCEILIAPIPDTNGEGPSDMTHYSVTCDGCNSQVVGFRYKCTTCYDYDLCSKCETAGLHPEHFMVRVPSPIVPRALIKAAIRRSRHFLKTVASATPAESHKRHRRDKSAEKQEHRERHGDRHHRDYHCRRPRTSWLETFTSYMNEFANLAGDVDVERPANQHQEEQKKPEEQQKMASMATDTQAPPQPESTGTATPTTHPFIPGMENIPKLIEMYFNGSLASFMQNAANAGATQGQNVAANSQTGASSTTEVGSNAQAAASSTPNPVPTTSDDVEMVDGAKKTQEALNLTLKTESTSSISGESVRDSSPDKADGWTMINKEKDLLDASDKPSDPVVDFVKLVDYTNLPKEFQQRVHINEGQSIYPPLNEATAVPERPHEPLVAQPAQATQAPQASFVPQAPFAPQAPFTLQAPVAPQTPTQPRPPQQQPPRVRHPLAHIDAAIENMLVMGFTNEGGWLTKLLESKDGNIAAVLDLLTPPKN